MPRGFLRLLRPALPSPRRQERDDKGRALGVERLFALHGEGASGRANNAPGVIRRKVEVEQAVAEAGLVVVVALGLRGGDDYRFKYVKSREYQLHGAASALLIHQLLVPFV